MSVETAKAKIEKEAAECGNMEKAIAAHLVSIMDDELAALVDRPEYTVKEMGRFVTEKARKELNGRNGYLADEVVYGFATDYYHATREEIKKYTLISISSKTPKNTTESKAAKPPKSIKDQQKAEEKKIKDAAKPAKKGKPQAEGQMSLFDMMGGLADA